MSSICTALSLEAVTIAYVLPPLENALMLRAPSSRLFASALSMCETARGELGSVMLITCTPSSFTDATSAYHPCPTWTMSTPCALSSSLYVPPCPSGLSSLIEATARGEAGLDTSTIWTPWSWPHGPRAAITAYVRPSITAVSTPVGALSMSNVRPLTSRCPSTLPETNLGCAGSVMSAIVNAPLSASGLSSQSRGVSAVMMAYVRGPISNVSMRRTPSSSLNPDPWSEWCRAAVATGLDGSDTSIICTPPPVP